MVFFSFIMINLEDIMAEISFTEDSVKSILKEICDNREKCGFEAFLIRNTEPKIKKLSLSEEIGSSGKTFRHTLKDMFLDIIKDTFLSSVAEYADGSLLADNQHKYLYFKQGEQFHPFRFLTTESDAADNFIDDDLENASGLAFKIRFGEDTIWLYQHLWSIMVPNRKKTNFMARVHKFENQTVLSEQNESLLTIVRRIDIVILGDYLVTDNTNLLQKNFGFQDYIYQSAAITVSQIEAKSIVANPEKLTEYISRGKPKYAKKMMRIATSKVFLLTAEQLIDKVETVERWKGKFDIDKEKNQINLNTYAQVESMIDLFDERYTRSEVTNTEYDTDVKSVAQPL